MCWLVCCSLVPPGVPPVPLLLHLPAASCIANIQRLPLVSSVRDPVVVPVVIVVVLRVCCAVVVVMMYCLVLR